MEFRRYFLVRLRLPNGHTIHLASDGKDLRIRGAPYKPIEIKDLQYNELGDKTLVVHEARLEVDI